MNKELKRAYQLSEGYKGKGMCKGCIYSIVRGTYGWLFCLYYQSWCKLVSRNCLGLKR